jgi:hypothetical protein
VLPVPGRGQVEAHFKSYAVPANRVDSPFNHCNQRMPYEKGDDWDKYGPWPVP